MKHNWKYLRKYFPWLLLILVLDLWTALLLWLVDAEAFGEMLLMQILGSVLLFAGICAYLCRRERQKEELFLEFLYHPDKQREEQIVQQLGKQEGELVRQIGEVLRKSVQAQNALAVRADDYAVYVEAWAHEIKNPLSLLTLLVDNRKDEMSPVITERLEYIRSDLQKSIDQMLYYARLRGTVKDYLFEPLSLKDCMEEVLEEQRPILKENEIELRLDIGSEVIFSDRRGLKFLFGQILSNSVKYRKRNENPVISIRTAHTQNQISLYFADNGIGVRSGDLPYIFEKGFTGDTGSVRTKATGMGLYLARILADDLKIELCARSQWQKGFEMELRFPAVEEPSK